MALVASHIPAEDAVREEFINLILEDLAGEELYLGEGPDGLGHDEHEVDAEDDEDHRVEHIVHIQIGKPRGLHTVDWLGG